MRDLGTVFERSASLGMAGGLRPVRQAAMALGLAALLSAGLGFAANHQAGSPTQAAGAGVVASSGHPSAAPAAAAQTVPVLLAPAQLHKAIGQGAAAGDRPLVLDLRESDGDDTLFHFAAGHIPGAVNLPYAAWRASGRQPGRLPDLSVLAQRLGQSGAHPSRWVVLVHDGSEPSEMGTAARAYWTLKSLGFTRLSILNGGYAEWLDADLPTTTEVMPHVVSAAVFEPRWNDAWQARREQLLAAPAGSLLLDARPKAFFDGQAKHPFARQPGTIRGASHAAFDQWLDDDGRVLPLDVLRQRAAKLGLSGEGSSVAAAKPAHVTTFCNAGHWAAIDWFVLSEVLQVPGTRLYAESIVDWAHAGLPMDNAPSRTAQLLAQWHQLWVQLADAFSALWHGSDKAHDKAPASSLIQQGAQHAG